MRLNIEAAEHIRIRKTRRGLGAWAGVDGIVYHSRVTFQDGFADSIFLRGLGGVSDAGQHGGPRPGPRQPRHEGAAALIIYLKIVPRIDMTFRQIIINSPLI